MFRSLDNQFLELQSVQLYICETLFTEKQNEVNQGAVIEFETDIDTVELFPCIKVVSP